MKNCTKCGQAVQLNSRFCGHCGMRVEMELAPPAPVVKKPSLGRLVLIKGESFDAASFQFYSSEHSIGRLLGTIPFPEDRYLSLKHAKLFFDKEQLHLQDEGSTNGVFVRIKQPVELKNGDRFLAGEQLFRFETAVDYAAIPLKKAAEDTKFYGCPLEDKIHFRLRHFFRDGKPGSVYNATAPSVNIGREQCELSFPYDRHISGRHARVYEENKKFYLLDMGSKNGTFYGISATHSLVNGDYFFVGQQLMRVELGENAAS